MLSRVDGSAQYRTVFCITSIEDFTHLLMLGSTSYAYRNFSNQSSCIMMLPHMLMQITFVDIKGSFRIHTAAASLATLSQLRLSRPTAGT